MIRVVRNPQPREVGNVLAECQPALDVRAGQHLVSIVLRNQLVGAGLELSRVLGRPPVAQRAGRVILTALIVEAVADLVADDDADAAVVDRRIGVRIEERGLQDRCRKDDLVLRRVVVSVHRLRGHAPFGAVERPAELVQIALVFERLRPVGIAERITGADFKSSVVAPLRRIADLRIEAGQLDLRLRLGRRRHPVERVNARRHRGAQVGDQCVRLRLRLGGEILRDVKPSDRLAERHVGRGDGALPARLLLGLTVEHGAVERERLVAERLGQHPGARLEDAQRHVIAPDRERAISRELGKAGEGGKFGSVELRLAANARGGDERRPVEARRVGGQPGDVAHLV